MINIIFENFMVYFFNPLGFLILIGFLLRVQYLLFRNIAKDPNNPTIIKALILYVESGAFRYPHNLAEAKQMATMVKKIYIDLKDISYVLDSSNEPQTLIGKPVQKSKMHKFYSKVKRFSHLQKFQFKIPIVSGLSMRAKNRYK